MHQLRKYQEKAVDNLRHSYKQKKRAPLLVMPTGSGKTHVFTYIATEAEKRGFRTLIIVHRSYLWKQCSNKLNDIGAEHGIIAPGHTLTSNKIQVASIDTLIRRLDKIIPPDLIIFDEGHHVWGNNKWGKVPNYFPNARILGVTATACRTSGQGLGKHCGGHYDVIVSGPQITELIPEYLAPFKLFSIKLDVDLKGVRSLGGDWARKELAKRVDKKSIYGDVPEHYKKICYGVPAIAFCVTVAHAEHVAEEFNRQGISAAAVSGKTSEEQRKYLFDGLANGKFLVLCSCDLVSEGFDVPVCGCAICLRHTQSTGLCLQQWGRTTRKAPGKKWAFIIDHVGNWIRHGKPSDFREWSLDGIVKSKNSEANIPMKTCMKCFHVHSPSPKCPECGYVYSTFEMKLPKTKEDIQLEEIELKQRIEAEKKEKIIARKKEQASHNTLDALKEYANKKGYKPGYVTHIWNSRLTKFHNADSIGKLYSAAKLIDFPAKGVPLEWKRRLQDVN